MPDLRFTREAAAILEDLKAPQFEKKRKKVLRTLARLEANPRHPGLNSHKYQSMRGAEGQDVWDSYVENQTPGAWRVFWHYGPGKNELTIITVGPHP